MHPISDGPVCWIGVEFSLAAAGRSRMQLPQKFLDELVEQVLAISRGGGRVSDSEAHKLVGRAARVAFVVPSAAPFSAALRAALADARSTASSRRRPGQRASHAAVRFATAAAWFVALLRGEPLDGRADLPLERIVEPGGRPQLTPGACEALVFDASPWGGGLVHFSGRRPVACQILRWTPELCQHFGGAQRREQVSGFLRGFDGAYRHRHVLRP